MPANVVAWNLRRIRVLSLHPEVERRVTSEIAGATAGRLVCADHLEMLPYTTQDISIYT